ncbi:uncharacterized protein si:ch73-345f18.3 [Notolabrus celidotus]|uniref:uncharacterized protein si:ch73-345f18.3 n=1 Tax=Notolabrus celidotus TaxID=1203425 RepID=UPI00148FA361|nr:uncharacterized protein si:ch73-345f18.3 [Notolabrus celidotus]
MLRILCCCCFSDGNSSDERQPLLLPGPPDLDGPGSARQTRPAHNDTQNVQRFGRLVMRRIGVPEFDQRFTDMAETFNEQQQRYESMVRHIRNLRQTYGCNHDDSLALAECVGKIREEHEAKHRVSLKIKGYDFSLNVVPVGSEGEMEDPMPPHLRLAQDELKKTSESAKATISKGTALQEMIGWLLRSKDQMTEQVKGAAGTYQEEGRLMENLEENIKEVRRAKELSLGYKQQAGEVLTEAAQIAGANL